MSRIVKYLVFLLLCFGLMGTFAGGEDLSVGSKAPDFKLPSLEKDQTISLSDYVNKKIVIVHFWKSM